MKVTVKHDRDDTGWIVSREGQFMTSHDVLHKDLAKALLAAHKEYPEAEIFVDDRIHVKFTNGMVMIKGEQELTPVEFRCRETKSYPNQ